MDNPYPICENCIFVDEPLDKDPCQECNRAFLAMRIKPNFVSKRKPQTNYDRIVSKTPYELAEWLTLAFQRVLKRNPMLENPPTYDGWLDWLKKEATE